MTLDWLKEVPNLSDLGWNCFLFCGSSQDPVYWTWILDIEMMMHRWNHSIFLFHLSLACFSSYLTFFTYIFVLCWFDWRINFSSSSSTRTIHAAFVAYFNFTIASFLSKKCTKIIGDWGFAPDPTGGAYNHRLREGAGDFLQTSGSWLYDVINLKCTRNCFFQLKMDHNLWRLVLRPQNLTTIS